MLVHPLGKMFATTAASGGWHLPLRRWRGSRVALLGQYWHDHGSRQD
jgi:hypothetical protein